MEDEVHLLIEQC